MKTLKAVGVAASAVAVVALGSGTANASSGYLMKNFYSGLCAGVGSQAGNGAPVIQWNCSLTAQDERWVFLEARDNNGNQAFKIKNVWSGKCMGVGSSLSQGAGVIQYTCNDSVDEKWWYNRGEWRNVYSGKCLGVGSSTTAGRQLIQYTCNSASDELWQFSNVTGTGFDSELPTP